MDIFAFVLEDEEKFQNQIYGALRKINPQVKIRFFGSLEDFSNWIAIFVKDGVMAIETASMRLPQDSEIESIGSEKAIRLLVCKNELLGSGAISLLTKTVELMVRKNACTAEERTSVIVTVFDQEQFDIKPLEVKIINNVIFKPFDSLILEEHMRYALIGRKKPTDENFKSNRLEAQVEMVKDIPCEGFSDLGFITVSDRELRLGEVNKFYCEEFSSGNIRSVMAKCIKSVPKGKGAGGFLCWMEYFGLETEQIKKFRKDLFNEFPSAHLASRVQEFKKNILIIDSLGETELGSSLKRFFPQVNAVYYTNWNQFLFEYSPAASGLLVEKDIPVPTGFVLTLDTSGHFILDQEPKSEIETVLGENFKDLKKRDFLDLLTEESKKAWIEVLRAQKVDIGREPILIFNNMGKKFLVRLMQISKSKNEAQLPVLELKLSEVPMIEKIAYLGKLSPIPKEINIVIASNDHMKSIIDGNMFGEAKKIMITKNQLSDKEKKFWSKSIYDVFVLPIDRNYLVKKIYLSFLETNLWWIKHFSDLKKEIQSAQQIQIDEISEAGLAFKYHRSLSVGSFRRFYLWTPNEQELRDYHANCNYFEEVKEGKTINYVHHFVFFGMKDFYLKNIRLWVRENYIQSKSKD